jgi:DNA-binding response OmpR family regulator
MRPKKTILHICGNEFSSSITRLLLETHGYAVESVSTIEDAINFLQVYDARLVIAECGPDSDNMAMRIKKDVPHIPVIIVSDVPFTFFADSVIPTNCLPAVFLPKIRLMCSRRSGPRPGSPSAMKIGEARRKPPTAEPPAERLDVRQFSRRVGRGVMSAEAEKLLG